MADLADVTKTLAQMASAALYPNGTGQPNVAIPAQTITVNDGWPEPKTLDGVLVAGNAILSVYPAHGMGRNTTRFLPQTQEISGIPVAQLTLTVMGNQITVGGAINPGEAAFISVNYLPYGHVVLQTDTLAVVASSLAALIPNATAAGDVVTVGGNIFAVAALVSVPTQMQSEIARDTQMFWLIAWVPVPTMRDAICKTVDGVFKNTPRIILPDNTWARLKYHGTQESDFLAKQRIYRRDLCYEVEYVTTVQETDNTVVNFDVSVQTPTATINFNIT